MKKFIFLVYMFFLASGVTAQVPNININQAPQYLNKLVTICDSVYSIKALEKLTLLNFGGNFPNAPLTLVVFKSDEPKFPQEPATLYNHKRICVTGMLTDYKGKPQIILRDQGMISAYTNGASNLYNAEDLMEISRTGIKPVRTEDNAIFTTVHKPPMFSGGLEAYKEYIEMNMIYPKAAKEAGIEGRVTLNFIVEQNGTLSDVKVLRGISQECDAEAVRLLKASPKFIPGENNGKPVRVSYSIPVVFKLPAN